MESIWTQDKIQSILPQRYPFLFIDKVLNFNKDNRSITCLKQVTGNELFFQGHFPGKPIMPGVIIIEAMAQASILLYAALKPEQAAKKPDYLLGKVEAKFKNIVVPGDELLVEVKGEKLISSAGIVTAKANTNKGLVAKATISFGVLHHAK